ncbi:LPD29 domain-containing protein [Xanthobacter aminoxidans]|uniref:LPD29 domain-containing protein n=1 Tax=Xanthobacter aminoxidans TaxID=186280 RepID=A0ABW6ZB86_9HYPH
MSAGPAPTSAKSEQSTKFEPPSWRTDRYISCTDTAKLVRAALKREFPGVRFSVRVCRYVGGGGSIDVCWVDGPEPETVRPVACAYEGARFDGMIDFGSHVTHYLTADGRAFLAEDHGTVGMHGTRRPHRAFKPTPDAERVRFGADYILCFRRPNLAEEKPVQASPVSDSGEAHDPCPF